MSNLIQRLWTALTARKPVPHHAQSANVSEAAELETQRPKAPRSKPRKKVHKS